ncbi:MAG TPA: hypothetical protein VIM53_04440 [Candidatus Saccharimonadales bacterium]
MISFFAVALNFGLSGMAGTFVEAEIVFFVCFAAVNQLGNAGKLGSRVGAAFGGLKKGANNMTKNAAKENMQAVPKGTRFSNRNPIGRKLNDFTRGVGTGTKGHFGIGEHGAEALTHNIEHEADEILKSKEFSGIKNQGDVMRVGTYKSFRQAQRGMEQEFYRQDLESQFERNVTAAERAKGAPLNAAEFATARAQAETFAGSRRNVQRNRAAKAIDDFQSSGLKQGAAQARASMIGMQEDGNSFFDARDVVESGVRSTSSDNQRESLAGKLNSMKGKREHTWGAAEMAHDMNQVAHDGVLSMRQSDYDQRSAKATRNSAATGALAGSAKGAVFTQMSAGTHRAQAAKAGVLRNYGSGDRVADAAAQSDIIKENVAAALEFKKSNYSMSSADALNTVNRIINQNAGMAENVNNIPSEYSDIRAFGGDDPRRLP